ncbi:MAG: hypothetical protein ACRCXZ_02965, partial [Patescibacteria group bacterium]
TACQDVNHRIPAKELKTYKNALKNYLGINGVWDINSSNATELMSPFTNRRAHIGGWKECYKPNAVVSYNDDNINHVKDMVIVLQSCHKAVECNNEYQNLVKSDPYFIRYNDKFDVCKSKYTIFNELDKNSFEANSKDYSDTKKTGKLDPRLNTLIQGIIRDYTKYSTDKSILSKVEI